MKIERARLRFAVEWAGKVKENICQTSRRLMAFLMAENQVCFYVPRDGDRNRNRSCSMDVAALLCGNLAADIKGRSCCKWLVLGRNERQPRLALAMRNRSSLLTLAKIR